MYYEEEQTHWLSCFSAYDSVSGDWRLMKVTARQLMFLLYLKNKYSYWMWMHSHSCTAHFIGLYLFSLMYCSSFYLWMVHTYPHSCTAHLEKPGVWYMDWKVQWSFGAMVYDKIDDTYARYSEHCSKVHHWECRGEAPARVIKHCSVPG